MIQLTRINRVPVVLNSDLIEHIEATPDTVISLTTGQKILVLEPPEEIVERVVQFRRECLSRCAVLSYSNCEGESSSTKMIERRESGKSRS